ncbi:MAG TPA: hypothetical protein DIW44_02575 [Anaerolineaceae bacterium]|nr:hypothetical protein [Anaerolineaceae bacterium]
MGVYYFRHSLKERLKMRTRLVVIVSLLSAIILSACGMQATPVYVEEGPDRDAIIAKTDVIVSDLISGIENKNYDTFSSHFSDVMLNSIKTADMEKIYTTFDPLGKSKSVELVNVQDAGNYYAVRYKVTYDKKVVIYRIVVDKADPGVQSGLWFE